jgi:hypothetical protein
MSEPSREEIIKTFAGFLEGWDGSHDWDNFVTYPLKNPNLEKVRKECFEVYHQYPSDKKGEWCSEEGFHELRRIFARLTQDV